MTHTPCCAGTRAATPHLMFAGDCSCVFPGAGSTLPGGHRTPRNRIMLKLALKFALPLCLLACTSPQKASVRDVPEKLHVPSGNKLALELHATGVQIYTCQPKKDDAAQFEWALKAPDARLVDAQGTQVAHHYAGPTWEAQDGSKVVGKLEQ